MSINSSTPSNLISLVNPSIKKALLEASNVIISLYLSAKVYATNILDAIKEIDTFLWTFSKSELIPHGTLFDYYKDMQPVYLSTKIENPDTASVLVLLSPRQVLDEIGLFDRVIGLFSFEEEALSACWDSLTSKVWKEDAFGKWSQSINASVA